MSGRTPAVLALLAAVEETLAELEEQQWPTDVGTICGKLETALRGVQAEHDERMARSLRYDGLILRVAALEQEFLTLRRRSDFRVRNVDPEWAIKTNMLTPRVSRTWRRVVTAVVSITCGAIVALLVIEVVKALL